MLEWLNRPTTMKRHYISVGQLAGDTNFLDCSALIFSFNGPFVLQQHIL